MPANRAVKPFTETATRVALAADFATPYAERYVARLLGIEIYQLRRMRWSGMGPQHCAAAEGGSRTIYEGRDLLAWLHEVVENPQGTEARRLRAERKVERRDMLVQSKRSRQRKAGTVDLSKHRAVA